MNTSNDSTGLDLSTIADPVGADYSPPIKMFIGEDGVIKYIPVKWEKNLIMYDLTISQGVYSNGSRGMLYAKIKIDNSKNMIHDRFEILYL